MDRNDDKKIKTNKNVLEKSFDLSEVKPEIQSILDDSLGMRGISINTTISEQDILRYFSQYMFMTDEKVGVIDHYEKNGTSWNVLPKDSIDKYSEKYFGKKIIGDNHKQKREIDSGWLEYYYKDQKYYFGFNPVGVRPETSFIVKEIVRINESTINCKVDSVINDGMGTRVDGNYSIDLEKKDNRYIIKNIKQSEKIAQEKKITSAMSREQAINILINSGIDYTSVEGDPGVYDEYKNDILYYGIEINYAGDVALYSVNSHDGTIIEKGY